MSKPVPRLYISGTAPNGTVRLSGAVSDGVVVEVFQVDDDFPATITAAAIERRYNAHPELLDLLSEIQWGGKGIREDFRYCPACDSPERDGHAADCRLAVALADNGVSVKFSEDAAADA